MKKLTQIMFHEHKIAMNNYTYNLNEIRVFHQICKPFLCSEIFLSEAAHCFLLLLIKSAPPEPMLPDLLQIFLAFVWGLILWTEMNVSFLSFHTSIATHLLPTTRDIVVYFLCWFHFTFIQQMHHYVHLLGLLHLTYSVSLEALVFLQ